MATALLESRLSGPSELDRSAARRTLRAQIGRLEGHLSAGICEAFPDRPPLPELPGGHARLQSIGELEELRDAQFAAVAELRAWLAGRELRRADARRRLALMLADPAGHRCERITQRELGEGGCGVWSVVPRLGPLGRLTGWWLVKLSSGCPLAT